MDSVTVWSDLIDKYAKLFSEIHIPLTVLCMLMVEMIIIFAIRYCLWTESPIKEDNSISFILDKKVLEHVLFEFLFAFTVAFAMMKLSNAKPNNIIVNFIFAPIIGLISSIMFDKKILSTYSKQSDDDSKQETLSNLSNNNNTNTTNSNVTINIGDDMSLPDDINFNNHKDTDKIHTIHTTLISKDDVNDKNRNELFRTSINELILNQKELSNELQSQSEMIDAMRDSMMIDMKYKLKSAMYECLNQGYATPTQNERIIDMYTNYRSLKGNGKIKKLYETHYSKLSIHWNKKEKAQSGDNKDRSNNDEHHCFRTSKEDEIINLDMMNKYDWEFGNVEHSHIQEEEGE